VTTDNLDNLLAFFDTLPEPVAVRHPSLPPHHQNYDFKNPDIAGEMARRGALLVHLRENPDKWPGMMHYYRDHPADWISDWCMTYDPRLKRVKSVPFVLFPRQREWIDWFLARRAAEENGITPKSRELGMSWLAMTVSVWMCLFEEGVSVGFGSQIKNKVDNSQNPDSLFWKGRYILANLPAEFTGDWNAKDNAIDMQLRFPLTGGMITGDCGDDIGRGGRKSVYFIDEAAHLERPEMAEASLSATTNCRIDISSVKGSSNPFGRKMTEGKVPSFLFHWRAQPLTARILTPTGWTTMGELNAGDEVFGIDGLPKKVLRILPQPLKEAFRVTFDDGASTECCGDHLWSVIPYGNQRAERRHIRKTMSLGEIALDYKRVDKRGFAKHGYQIPLAMPVHFAPSTTLPVDPYVLGALLGDGSFPKKDQRPIVMSKPECDAEIISLMSARLPEGCSLVHDGGLQYRVSVGENNRGGVLGRGRHNPINYAARALGLAGTVSHTKFVPQMYLFASPAERLDLLQGLMDTDGDVPKSEPNSGRFTTVSPQLAADVVFLAQSLGGTASVYDRKAECRIFPGGRIHDCRKGYTVAVRLPMGMNPFKMARKAGAYKPSGKRPPRRSIVNIESVGEKAVQCIEVEGHLYLTDDCVVTHNCDPRKDDAWYAKMCEKYDPVTIAQEVDIDISASVEGIVIPAIWVRAAIDAHVKLGITVVGSRTGSFDVADEGKDDCAFAGKHGILLDHMEVWKGKGSDIFDSVKRVFRIADLKRYPDGITYDGDGLGSGVRGDARVINSTRGGKPIMFTAFRGSASPDRPEGSDVEGRKNKEMFLNKKAQGWWALRCRFERTYKWVTGGVACGADDIISLSRELPGLQQLVLELSQPTYTTTTAGRILIDKQPEGSKSPNRADAVMLLYGGSAQKLMKIDPTALARMGVRPGVMMGVRSGRLG
jgi:hypothetical protein